MFGFTSNASATYKRKEKKKCYRPMHMLWECGKHMKETTKTAFGTCSCLLFSFGFGLWYFIYMQTYTQTYTHTNTHTHTYMDTHNTHCYFSFFFSTRSSVIIVEQVYNLFVFAPLRASWCPSSLRSFIIIFLLLLLLLLLSLPVLILFPGHRCLPPHL